LHCIIFAMHGNASCIGYGGNECDAVCMAAALIRMGKIFLEKFGRPIHEEQHMFILMSSGMSQVMPETGSLEGEFLVAMWLQA
jgi:hypothetical protein